MRKVSCRSMNCTIYGQLANVRISDAERQRAEYALRDAHAVVDALIWIRDKVASLAAWLPGRGLRHHGHARP